MLEKRTFQTSKGPVPVWGRLDGFSADRPLLFVIRGAFPGPEQLIGLADLLPHCDVALVHLPGMHTPLFSEHCVEAFAAAFDEVLATLRARHVVVLGISLGGVVAMAMRHAGIKTALLLDTPLSTEPVWPLPIIMRRRIEAEPVLAPWIWALFGISMTKVENRDYRPLVANVSVPTGVMLGGVALGEPRPIERDPSAVCDEDRAVYRSNPLIKTLVIPNVGHNIARHAQPLFMDTLRRVTGLVAA